MYLDYLFFMLTGIYTLLLNNANKNFNKNGLVYAIGCVRVGFLKFLKREKKDTLDELDLPPAPPPLEGFEENMPELPDFLDFGDEKGSGMEMPNLDFPEEEKNIQDFSKEETMPEFPSFPEMDENPTPIQPVSSNLQIPEPLSTPQPEFEPEQEEISEEQPMPSDTYPKTAGRLFSQEKRILRERPSAKTIYVSVDNFKATLGSINMVRSDLRKSEEALMKLESIKNAKDKSFDKMKSSLDDLQRKLIFVDKTLFKGE